MVSVVDVVLPCLNEAEALPGVIASLPEGYRAIVVDNGSTDGSDRIAREAGATVVSATKRGYGSAVHTGLLAASAPVVAFCDADGSFDLSELSSLVEPIASGKADLALGRRTPVQKRVWPWHARFANAVLLRWVRARIPVNNRDLGPMRAARRDALLELGIEDRRSGYPLELLVRASKAGWRITESPVSYHPRLGRSKVTGTVRGTAQAVGDMTQIMRRLT